MAELNYMRGEHEGGVTPIQDMNTRQLRKYIRERAEEAQERMSTLKDLDSTSAAFQNQYSFVTSFGSGRGGAIKKDTSHMSKEEMAEYAYALRDLNMLDTESRYAINEDYKENRQRYEAFIRERTREDNPNIEEREKWKKYITEKNNVSKRGYIEYKNFINFVRNIDEVMSTYGYETVKDYYYDETDAQERQVVEDLLIETYEENLGEGLTPSELIDHFNEKLAEHKAEKNKQAMAEANAKKTVKRSNKTVKRTKNTVPKVKAKQKKTGSGANVKVKKAGKLKGGSVRNRQTT